MNSRKKAIRFFTIADYEEEEAWLHEQHKNGWALFRMIPPCVYIFEKCAPEDVAYRLDYTNNAETSSYYQIFRDYGWEYIGRCVGWLYFRKPRAEMDCEQDGEIFSDSESKMDLIDHVIKTRFLPCLIILLCCVIPTLIRSTEYSDPAAVVLTVILSILTLFYVYLLVYCGLKLQKLRERYRRD